MALLRSGFPRYIAGRFAVALGTLVVVTTLVFVGMQLVPGSYADTVVGPSAPPEAREILESKYGLDRSLPEQYLDWAEHLVQGDLGSTLGTGESVGELIAERAPVTLELALLSLLFTTLIGLPLAMAAGVARNRATRGVSRLFGAAAISTPEFVLGSLFVYLFSKYQLGLPVGVYVPFSQDPLGSIEDMILPAITLTAFGVAMVLRTGRDSIANVIHAPHVTAALARGETMPFVLWHHVIRNASIPVVTVIAVYVGYLLGGAVIVENLFSLPGLGQLVIGAVNNHDYQVVQGVVLVGAAAFIFVNMAADFAYGIIDPRIAAGGKR
jgi:peptide/nickel transport system permease protein